MQKEHTIHINVTLRKEGTQNVALVKNRIWPSLLVYLQWATFGKTIPGDVSDGLGLTIINNLAIIAEGVITDLTEEYIAQSGTILNSTINFDHSTWSKKKDIYNQLFAKKLEDYPCYQSVQVLFAFRNNIAHGRSHSEISKIESTTNEKLIIESENRNYETIRKYLIDRRLMDITTTSSNINQLWKLENALFLFSEVRHFLNAVIEGNESTFKEGILSEWKMAVQR